MTSLVKIERIIEIKSRGETFVNNQRFGLVSCIEKNWAGWGEMTFSNQHNIPHKKASLSFLAKVTKLPQNPPNVRTESAQYACVQGGNWSHRGVGGDDDGMRNESSPGNLPRGISLWLLGVRD